VASAKRTSAHESKRHCDYLQWNLRTISVLVSSLYTSDVRVFRFSVVDLVKDPCLMDL